MHKKMVRSIVPRLGVEFKDARRVLKRLFNLRPRRRLPCPSWRSSSWLCPGVRRRRATWGWSRCASASRGARWTTGCWRAAYARGCDAGGWERERDGSTWPDLRGPSTEIQNKSQYWPRGARQSTPKPPKMRRRNGPTERRTYRGAL